MARQATVGEIQCILKDSSDDLEKRLHLTEAQFGIPVDGAGLRIRVSVPPGCHHAIPGELDFDVNGETVTVSLEVAEDYEPMEAF